MRVLITGAGGFIGPHLTVALEKEGHEVTGCGFECPPLDGDLLVGDNLALAFEASKPHVVYHLAATVGRVNGDLLPAATIANNVNLTGNVARMCALYGARMVYASSSEIYEPHNIYGYTKLWGEQLARHYLDGDLTVARISMPYGPQHPPGEGRCALTNFLWLALHDRPLRVHRGALRSWCWIGDTCRTLAGLVYAPIGPRGVEYAYNVGRDNDLRPIEDVAALAVSLTNSNSKIIEVELPAGVTRVKDLPCLTLSGPMVDLPHGMEITRDWLASLEVRHAELA